jgi:Sortase domain
MSPADHHLRPTRAGADSGADAAPGAGRLRLVGAGAVVVAVLGVVAAVVLTTQHHRGANVARSAGGSSRSTSTMAATPVPAGSGARAQFIPSAGAKLQVPEDPPRAAAAPAAPVHVDVPSLHISSSLESLGLLPDGTMKPPTEFGVAGWYAGGTRPGAVGPAVIAGHIDSLNGPGIFLDLGQIKVGASVVVTTKSAQRFRFTVTDVKEYPKDKFPAAIVYGPTPVATLRLITCTGKFNYSTHHYLDNLVVTSVLDQPNSS